MKFKTIFILFNAVVLFSFMFIFLIPLFLLGGEYTLGLWKSNWFLAIFFLAILGALNFFFLSNWKLFEYVEREDWESLNTWLSRRMFEKGSFRNQYIRLYVNAAMLRSDLAAIDRLEAVLSEKKPERLRRQAVLFGVGYLLRNDPDASLRFFEPFLKASNVEAQGWLWFDYAFNLVLKNRGGEALPWLRKASAQRDSVLALLAIYMMGTLVVASLGEGAERDSVQALVKTRRDSLRKRFTPARWSREVEKAKNDVHVVILSRLIDDAGRWLFEAPKE